MLPDLGPADQWSNEQQNELFALLRGFMSTGLGGPLLGASGICGQVVGSQSDSASTGRNFELYEALTPGGQAEAYLREWVPHAQEYVTNTDLDTFTVHDVRGVFRGRGRDDYDSPHDTGSIGFCVERNSRWEIDWLQPHMTLIRGVANTDWTAHTFQIKNITGIQPTGGLIVDQDPAGPMNVDDEFDWDGSEDDLVFAAWNGTSSRWEAFQLVCPG